MNAPTSHVLTGSVFMRSSLVLGSSMPWAKYTKRRGCKTIGPPIVFRADGTKRCGDNDGIHEDCGGRGRAGAGGGAGAGRRGGGFLQRQGGQSGGRVWIGRRL